MVVSCTLGERRFLLASGLGLTLAVGCASPAPPRPPSLRLPEIASKLEGKRVDDVVRLTWLTSSKTTDGVAIHGPVTAIICREMDRGASLAKPKGLCNAIQRIAVPAGPSVVEDALPLDLRTGTPTLLVYKVELLNASGRSAGRSEPVYVAGGAAPSPVGEITISARRKAALIQWRVQPGDSPRETTMELLRTTTTSQGTSEQMNPVRRTPGQPFPRTVKAPDPKEVSGSKGPAGQLLLTTETKNDGQASHADPGGMLDAMVRDSGSYVYVAQRIRKVSLEGHDLEIRGVASPPVAFTYRDTFAPGVPLGLISVPGTGFGGPPSIDLSWDPSSESDLLGYNVYRRSGSGAFVRLNPEPTPSSSYRDMQVSPGHSYAYRVTAIDRQGNESAPSSEIHETLRQ